MLKKYGDKRMRESVEGKMQQGERGRRRGWRAGGKRRALSKISNWRMGQCHVVLTWMKNKTEKYRVQRNHQYDGRILLYGSNIQFQ